MRREGTIFQIRDIGAMPTQQEVRIIVSSGTGMAKKPWL